MNIIHSAYSSHSTEISVVIPTYNRAHFLVGAIESVFSQTHPAQEIIVVDDGSTDGTMAVVKKYNGRVRYLLQQNKGPAAARNRGIREAQGEFIAFLDSDDDWLPEKLELQVELFQKNPGLGLIATGSYICNEHMSEPVPTVWSRFCSNVREDLLVRNPWPTPSIMVRKRCFDQVGFFAENMWFAEDWEMWIRISREFLVMTLSQPLVRIRKHGISLNAENCMKNFQVWGELIISNRERYGMSWAAFRKAQSWLSFNISDYYNKAGEQVLNQKYLVKSLYQWPFFLPRRYAALVKSLVS